MVDFAGARDVKRHEAAEAIAKTRRPAPALILWRANSYLLGECPPASTTFA